MTTYIPIKFRLLLVVLGTVLVHDAGASVNRKDYDAVIQTTKGNLSAGQLAPAIDQLRRWHLADPQDKRIVYDLAALLDKAGDYQSAESYYQQIIQANAPAYAINAVAHAALKNQHFPEAEAAYQLLIRKTPDDINAHVGLVYAWMGQQRIQQAFDYAKQHLPRSEQHYSAKDVPMLVALAEIEEQRKAWLQAASVYQQVLKLNPEFRYARRGLVFAMSKAGMFYLAKQNADRYPSDFTEAEKYQLAHDSVAQTIHFGQAQIAYENNPSRFNTMDIALAENKAVAAQFRDLPTTKFDRVIALKDRGDMLEAVQLYRTLVDDNISTPPYVKFAAADAYLFLEQPNTARDLYLEGLKDYGDSDPDTLQDIKISLMYAYSEAGQYQEAETLADQILASQPPVVYKGMAGLEQANPNYLLAYLNKARLETSHDRLDRAEEHLKTVRVQAPFNNDIRSAWGSLQAARDHPRAALNELTMLSVDHPTSVDATVGRGEALLALNEFAQAKPLLPPLMEANPDNKAVLNYAEKLENYGRPFYKIESMFGRGQVANGADSLVDAVIYSAPLTNVLSDHFRLLSHLVYARGETRDNVTASRTRLGVGLDYRARDFSAEAEINHTLNNPNSNGIALQLGWNISDAWLMQAAADTNTINLPAAALAEDITAKEVKLDVTWTKNESRKAGGEISSMRFSDSNVRNMAAIWWMERWLSTPVFKLDTRLFLSTSTNSERNRDYFNPERDEDVDLELKAEWLTWRHYRRSFTQRAVMDVGHYWQKNFGSGATAGLRYEHQWTLENEMEITYGVGRNFQPYDGVREYRKYIYLNLSGRIK